MDGTRITDKEVKDLVTLYLPVARHLFELKDRTRDLMRDKLGGRYPDEYATRFGEKDPKRPSSRCDMVCPDLGSWFWECEKSPFGVCLYDTFWDRAHDTCVFCGDPEERK